MDSRHTLGKSRTRAAKDSPVGLFSTQLGRCGRWPWVAWNLHQASGKLDLRVGGYFFPS